MKIVKKIFLALLLIIVAFIVYAGFRMHISTPDIDVSSLQKEQRTVVDSTFFTINNNWLRQNKKGLWEMYVEGTPIELGVYEGKMSKELIYNQEKAFVDQIKMMIPSDFYLSFLKYFIGWFNRDITENIPEEFKDEIYGISLSTSDEFNFVANNYQRMLNYHGAHDIGHALKDLALVGCTSFIANQNRNDSNMIVGRNFDFYISDDFAKDKVIAFVSPDSGYQFAYVSWASFIGVVSGMNTEGVTVTINAAKSDIPTEAKTPISILAREILQYSSNIDDAIRIAKKRNIFVSESILVGSAKDDRAVIIEKSPTKMGIFSKDGGQMVCANHFQSQTFANDENTIKNKAESASVYRQQRCEQLLHRVGDTVSYVDVSAVLRDTRGLNDKNIGLGNEKAMNQLISHHSVIFLPKQLKIWVSTAPYQLGEYLCYDLNEVFAKPSIPAVNQVLYIDSLTIPDDTLLHSQAYANYKTYKRLKAKLMLAIKQQKRIADDEQDIASFIASNSYFFYTYEVAGNYLATFGEKEKARTCYKQALQLEISNVWEAERIKASLTALDQE